MSDITQSEVEGLPSRRQDLLTLRMDLWRAMNGAMPREAASISKELRAVVAELDAMPAPESRNTVDEVARARELRRAGAQQRAQ